MNQEETDNFKEVVYEGIMKWKDEQYDSPNKEFLEAMGDSKREDIYGGFTSLSQPRIDSSIESC